MIFYVDDHLKYKEYFTNKRWQFAEKNDYNLDLLVGFRLDKDLGTFRIGVNVYYYDYLHLPEVRTHAQGIYVSRQQYDARADKYLPRLICYYAPIHKRYSIHGDRLTEWWRYAIDHGNDIKQWIADNNIQRPLSKADQVIMKLRFT